MARGNEARGGALEVKNTKSDGGNGSWTVSTGDSSNEQSIRGGSGTSMSEKGPVIGGDLNQAGVTNGYPSNNK